MMSPAVTSDEETLWIYIAPYSPLTLDTAMCEIDMACW